MDLNLTRRKREVAIAHEVVVEFLRKVPAAQASRPEALAHHFAIVCERLGVLLNEAAVGRVLAYASKELALKIRRMDRIAGSFDTSAPGFNGANNFGN
jgi:hypothetical protein